MHLRLLVPGDPRQATGGYIYDAHIARGLRDLGCAVDVIGLDGRFPDADDVAARALDSALGALPDGSLVIVDGLALGGLPEVAAAHAARLVLVALVHHPLADEWGIAPALAERFRVSERRALQAVRHVIVTSRYTARRLEGVYGVAAACVSVVEPGVRRMPEGPAPVPGALARLLCVATLVPRKGHAVLVEALARIPDLPWHCDLIGPVDRDPICAAAVRAAIAASGLQERIAIRGEVSAADLQAAYRSADVFVLPSYFEGYGMAITEALSHALPVITTTGGALAETLPPEAGLAVAPGDATALAAALRGLMTDAGLWQRLADGARRAARDLPRWDDSARRFLAVLRRLRAAT